MRIISLNIWGGKIFNPLLKFISEEADKTDIFCFQEVFFLRRNNTPIFSDAKEAIFFEIQKILREFQSVKMLAPEKVLFEMKRLPAHLLVGETIFIKSKFNILDSGGFITYDIENEIFLREGIHNGGCFQYVRITDLSKEFLIGNLHGLWQSDGKDDSPDRNYQTKKVLDFFNSYKCGKILMGDFNIRPASASIKNFNKIFSNLIEKNNISKTRTVFYKDMEKYGDYISDYAFVSPDISVKSFIAPEEIIVSDHSPLILEIS